MLDLYFNAVSSINYTNGLNSLVWYAFIMVFFGGMGALVITLVESLSQSQEKPYYEVGEIPAHMLAWPTQEEIDAGEAWIKTLLAELEEESLIALIEEQIREEEEEKLDDAVWEQIFGDRDYTMVVYPEDTLADYMRM